MSIIVVSILALLLLGVLLFLHRRNKQLDAARNALKSSNAQLSALNTQLSAQKDELSTLNGQLSMVNNPKTP
jgi:type II secretory pathway pseudopilin PulG